MNRLVLLERPVGGRLNTEEIRSMLIIVQDTTNGKLLAQVDSEAREIASSHCGQEGPEVWQRRDLLSSAHFTDLDFTDWPYKSQPFRKFIGDYICR